MSSDNEKLRQKWHEHLSRFIILLVGEILPRRTTYSVGGLLKEGLMMFNFSCFETILDPFQSLDQVSKWGIGMTDKSVITRRGQSAHENHDIFLLCESRLDLWSSLAPPLSIFTKLSLGFLLIHCSYSRSGAISELNLYNEYMDQIRPFLKFWDSEFCHVRAAQVRLLENVEPGACHYRRTGA